MGNPSQDKDKIIEAIRGVARELGHPPSKRIFKAITGVTERQVFNHFLSWNAAVEAAGLDPNTSKFPLEDPALLEDWGAVVKKLRHIPTSIQYRHYGNFSTDSLQKRFGPWSTIPDAFRQFAQDKPEWDEVLTLLPVAPTSASPTTSSSPSYDYVDQMDSAHSTTGRKAVQAVHSKLENRTVYGNPIDFRGLRHEPVNEMGVVFLFGMVARELGYSVEAVRQEFPDCEAKRQVGRDKWQWVRIEFEYESRNFRDHSHKPDGCDIIVCWRHNWAECPENIEVVELSEVIKRLGKSDE
jgi:hypothetical protein